MFQKKGNERRDTKEERERKRKKEERERKKNALIGSQPQAILKAEKREREIFAAKNSSKLFVLAPYIDSCCCIASRHLYQRERNVCLCDCVFVYVCVYLCECVCVCECVCDECWAFLSNWVVEKEMKRSETTSKSLWLHKSMLRHYLNEVWSFLL